MWVPPATMLRDLVLLDPDGERLVFGMRAHPDSAALLTRADDLEELIGFAARQRSASVGSQRGNRTSSVDGTSLKQ